MFVFRRVGVGEANELQSTLPNASKKTHELAPGVGDGYLLSVEITAELTPGPSGQVPLPVQFGSICAICVGPTPNVPAATGYSVPL